MGSSKSLLTAREFFLSPKGRINPQQELIQNLEAFDQNEKYACTFPARALWISRQLKLNTKKCVDVEEWKKKINAETVAIVHVSQFVSNPSSAFGHSFLLFQNSVRPLNLQTAINNAAEIPEDVSAWDYVTKGLFGGFPGGYSLEPFYIKIQEYNHIENRDMWVYELNLNSERIDQLLNHIWELTDQGTESYYFLNRNCAVNIFNAVAAITPDLDFISENRLYVIPIEAIQRVKNLVVKKTYYPSLREKIILKQNHLKNSKNPKIEELEVQLDLFEYKKSQNFGELTDEEAKSYSESLMKRSKLGLKHDVFDFTPPRPPDGAMKTWRAAIGWDQWSDENRARFSFSPLFHSIVQRTDGYLPNSEIIAMNLEVSADNQKRYSMENLTLLRLINLPTSSDFDNQTAFRFQASFERKSDCLNCHFFSMDGAIGKSLSLKDQTVFYVLVGAAQAEDQILRLQLVSGTVIHFSSMILNLEYRFLADLTHFQKHQDYLIATLGWTYSENRDFQFSGRNQNGDLQYSALFGFHY